MSSSYLTAIHLMTYLAHKQDSSVLVTSEELATTISHNAVVVRRLVSKLKEAGLVDTVRGKHGGFRLSRSASDICLLAVFRAIEGNDPDLFSLANMDKRIGCSPIVNSIQETLNDLLRQSLDVMKSDLATHSVNDILNKSLAQINITRCS